MSRMSITSAVEWGAGVRLAAILALILVFFFQGQLIQTHIHGAPASGGWSLSSLLDADDGNTDKQIPAPDNNCPVCQIAAHGQYLTPSAAASLPALFILSTITLAVEATRLIDTISHSWQGRAPPQV